MESSQLEGRLETFYKCHSKKGKEIEMRMID